MQFVKINTFPKAHAQFVFCLLAALWVVSPLRLNLDGTVSRFISPSELLIVALVILITALLPEKALTRIKPILAVMAALLLFSSVIFLLKPSQGLIASYYANNDFSGKPESEWRFKKLEKATRIDSNIAFEPIGLGLTSQEFPLYFLNNDRKYGNEHLTEERKNNHKHFLFSAKWQGYIQIPKEVTNIQIQNNAGIASLKIGSEYSTKNINEPIKISVSKGIYPIELTFKRTTQSPPLLKMLWKKGENVEIIPSKYLSPISKTFTTESLQILNIINYFLFALILLILISKIDWFRVARNRIELLIIGSIILILAAYNLDRVLAKNMDLSSLILSPGNDWLGYETQARDILSGDWLNINATSNNPFYWNIF